MFHRLCRADARLALRSAGMILSVSCLLLGEMPKAHAQAAVIGDVPQSSVSQPTADATSQTVPTSVRVAPAPRVEARVPGDDANSPAAANDPAESAPTAPEARTLAPPKDDTAIEPKQSEKEVDAEQSDDRANSPAEGIEPAQRAPDATRAAVPSQPEPQPPEAAASSGQAAIGKVPRRAIPRVKRRLIVRSWAGAYGEAQAKAIIQPVSQDLGIDIERQTHAGSMNETAGIDVTELDQLNLIAACASGQLMKLGSRLSPDRVSSNDAAAASSNDNDSLAIDPSPCGVPTFAWSSILIANGNAMKKLAKRRYKAPSQLADLLDVKTYPGKRALIRSPHRLLEMALMGTGTERADVYRVLATREGQDAAFNTLDALSKHVIWVDGPREALLALDGGMATMAMTYSGRAFRRLVASRMQPIWDGHVIDYASWAVPTATRNGEAAKRFILAATTAESLAAQARIWPYGPMRRSAVALARRHTLLDTELDPYMPTSELRFRQGLVFNAAFWTEYGPALKERFEAWLDGVPLGIRVPTPSQAPPPPMPPLPRRSAG